MICTEQRWRARCLEKGCVFSIDVLDDNDMLRVLAAAEQHLEHWGDGLGYPNYNHVVQIEQVLIVRTQR